MSFWAIFTASIHTPDNELDFENKLWRELSLLSSQEERAVDWGNINASDPNDPFLLLQPQWRTTLRCRAASRKLAFRPTVFTPSHGV